jgi:hypothetical protein
MTDQEAIEELRYLLEDAPLYQFSIKHAIRAIEMLAKAWVILTRTDKALQDADVHPESFGLGKVQVGLDELRELLEPRS